MTFQTTIPRLFIWTLAVVIALTEAEVVASTRKPEGPSTLSSQAVKQRPRSVDGVGKVLVAYHPRYPGSLSSALIYSLDHAKADEAEVVGESPDLSKLGLTDTLYLVSHGRAGALINDDGFQIPVESVTEALVHPRRGLPKGFKGVVHLVVCQGGLPSAMKPSLVDQFALELGKAGFDDVEVVGARGSVRTNRVDGSYDIYTSDEALRNWLDYWEYSAAFFTGTLLPEERNPGLEDKLGLKGFGRLSVQEAGAVKVQERVALNPDLAAGGREFQEFMLPLYRLIADSLEGNLGNVANEPIFMKRDSTDRLHHAWSKSEHEN